MKRLRWAALAAVVLVCLLVAPPAVMAEDGTPPIPPKPLGVRPGGWAAEWLERLVEWFGWGEETLRPVVAPGKPIGPDTSPVPPPTAEGDCGGGIIPDGAPCHA